MAQSGAVKPYFTFIQGIVTEANALTYPENASVDEANFILNRDGSRQRRFGMDYENTPVMIDTGVLTSTYIASNQHAVSSHEWKNVGNNPDINLAVIQFGSELYFFDLFADSISSNQKNSSSTLSLSITGNEKLQSAYINGNLILVSKELTYPVKLSYDSITDSVTATNINLKVRDFWGVADSLELTERPTGLSDLHEYNLCNQGWFKDNYQAVKTGQGEWPSNADIQHLAKDSNDNFSSAKLYKKYFGTTPAPKGKYIIDLFDRGASRISASSVRDLDASDTPDPLVLPDDIENGAISSITSFAGRVFYSGIDSTITDGDSKSPNLSGYILFSQLIDNDESFGKCYQEADPSSEYVSDLIDTDGGFVIIPEANDIKKLITTRNSIAVIASNGVWEITGAETGFTATNYMVRKVSTVGALSSDSVVNAEGNIFFFADAGIYTLVQDDVTGYLKSVNISETTIQTLYSEIPEQVKSAAIGTYDVTARKVLWMYTTSEDFSGTSELNKFDKELIFDLVTNAFTKNEVSSLTTDSPYIATYINTSGINIENYVYNVTHNGSNVTVGGVQVTVTRETRGTADSSVRYLTIKPNTGSNIELTFSYFRNDSYMDWYSEDSIGADYSSYLITGYEIAGDSMRYKQVPYITFHFERTETGFQTVDGELEAVNPSSCFVRARWDYADSSSSGKFGTPFQAYRLSRNYIPLNVGDTFDYGRSVITTKNKLRGRGRALSLHIYSETGYDMHLLGWSIVLTGGSVV